LSGISSFYNIIILAPIAKIFTDVIYSSVLNLTVLKAVKRQICYFLVDCL